MPLLLLNVLSNLYRETGDNVKFAISTERRDEEMGEGIIYNCDNQQPERRGNDECQGYFLLYEDKYPSSCCPTATPPEELSCFPCRGEEYNIIAYLDHIVLHLITTTTTAVHDQNSFPLITFPFSVCSPVEFLLRHPLHMSDPCSSFAPPHHLQLLTE